MNRILLFICLLLPAISNGQYTRQTMGNTNGATINTVIGGLVPYRWERAPYAFTPYGLPTDTVNDGIFWYNRSTKTMYYWDLLDSVSMSGGGGGGSTTITFAPPLTGGTINTTGTVSIPAATGSVNGYLTSTAYNIFNGKQDALGYVPLNVTAVDSVGNSPDNQHVPTTALTNTWIAAIYSTLGTSYYTRTQSDARYNRLISFTTTGTSGASTFDGINLNIPNYAGQTYTASGYQGLSGNSFYPDTSGRKLATQTMLTSDSATLAAATASKQAQLNGTGLVRMAGTTLSYDNTAYGTGSVTSVGLTVPAAFSVTPTNISTTGTFAMSATGTSAQYVRGDGALATTATSLPPSGAAGGDLTGTFPNPTLNPIGTAGTYAYPQSVTTDAAGRVTAVTAGSAPTTYTATSPITLSAGAFGLDKTAPYIWSGAHTFTASTAVLLNGATVTAGLTNLMATFQTSVNAFAQVNVQNSSNGATASGDIVITADNGTNTTHYVDWGVNSSGFSDGTFTVVGADDAYLYSTDNIGFGTSTAAKDVVLFTGGTLSANERMRVNDSRVTLTGVQINYAAAQTIASATTTNLCTATSNVVYISGTTTIASLGSCSPMSVMYVKFQGALTLTYNATSMLLLGAVSKTTVANDEAVFENLGGGNWKCISYTPYTVTGTGATMLAASPTTTGTLTTAAITASGTISATGTTATIGSSTATSVLGFGTGATVSASTKTVNIGTGAIASGGTQIIHIGDAAAAGSTNTITIGSTAGTSTTALQGTVNATTPPAGDNSTKVATTAYVDVPMLALTQTLTATSATTLNAVVAAGNRLVSSNLTAQSGNCFIANPTGSPQDGCTYRIYASTAAAVTFTFGTAFSVSTDISSAVSTAGKKTLIIATYVAASSTWYLGYFKGDYN